MDETLNMLGYAKNEIVEINEELDIHSEKLGSLRKKISAGKEILTANTLALGGLENALKIRKFLVIILAMVLGFAISYFLISRKL
jgi:hypothetical protein